MKYITNILDVQLKVCVCVCCHPLYSCFVCVQNCPVEDMQTYDSSRNVHYDVCVFQLCIQSS